MSDENQNVEAESGARWYYRNNELSHSLTKETPDPRSLQQNFGKRGHLMLQSLSFV
jgi:hypothetical protein